MKTRLRTLKTKGFALVATLSLMILLTLIAVGLLTLSTVTVRSGGREEAMATARANARLALMIALGELQRTMGPDQSVSAPASAVINNAAQPRLTGAWEGWRWTPTVGGSPNSAYAQKQNKFHRWLISTADPKTAEQFAFATKAATTDATTSVKLVGDYQDSQKVSTQVYAEKTSVGDSSKPGKIAWAVFDESLKAPVNLGDPKTAQKDGEEIGSRNAPYRVRADVNDTKLEPLKTPEKLYSFDTTVLPIGIKNADEIRKRFHDFTTNSMGLLTDTANGGLKKDLTSLFEEATLPNDAFTSTTPYPSGFNTANGAPLWTYLQNHYRKYKALTISNGVPSYNLANQSDLVVNTNLAQFGVNPSPDTERLLPTIAKFQMVFSLVSHSSFNVDSPTRRTRLDTSGDPKGWQNYGVIHLASDPVVTLYNPYDVTLDLSKIRIRIWDPPVVFRFRKYDRRAGTSPYFRSDQKFARLAQLQLGLGTSTTARKCITLVLADGTSQRLGRSLQLKPGEVKVYSPRIETSWNWGVDANPANGYGEKDKVFFDWNPAFNLGNVDHRNTATAGAFGMECSPGWDTRGGLQPDHLAEPREPTSRYSFEPNNGYVTLRKTDDVEVEIKPEVAAGGATQAQFQVDVLAAKTTKANSGLNVNTDTTSSEEAADTLRSYRFTFNDPTQELSETPSSPVIKRLLNTGAIFQSDTEKTKGGKTPFAMLEMSARTTKQADTKPWLFNNFVVEGGVHKSSEVGLALQAYDVRLIEMSSFTSFPTIEIDPNNRGFFGGSSTAAEGSSFVTMLHVPLTPAASLGDLIPTNMVASALPPRVVHPFGNSRAHPLIDSSQISRGAMMDHTYLLNDALWDSYFFSSFTNYNTSVFSQTRDQKTVMTDLFDGKAPALNTRLTPVTSSGDSATLVDELIKLSATKRSKQIAKHVAVSGPFNVNSTSVDAWRAALSSLRDRAINGLVINGSTIGTASYSSSGKTPFVRSGRPLSDDSAPTELRWAAFRTLTDKQIESLAKAIVDEIKNRGQADSAPCLSLGEFVNRRPGSATSLHSLKGIIQTAIDESDINDDSYRSDSKDLVASSINRFRRQGMVTTKAMDGKTAEGVPTVITQGDLMAGLATIATVRGDTFKIRAYGEALSPEDGKTVLARAWCEAVVQRVPEFVDPANPAETEISSLNQTNKVFGRRFEIVSFKQLSEDEL